MLTATHAEPHLGRLLAEALLTGCDPASPFHREIAETALVYLDTKRFDLTAAALHLHLNTVKYRLRRLQEITGHALADTAVAETTHWWWALRYRLCAGPPDPSTRTTSDAG